jgi:hypothetical protein
MLWRQRKTTSLRSHFGPEYERALQEHGDRAKAESELERRQRQREKLSIRPLPPMEREEYLRAWREDQARFVDDPRGAVEQADRMIVEIMKKRGYPVSNFERRVEDISVDHPHVVENYLAASEIMGLHRRGEAGTEDLRRAMVYYRALFNELLELQEVKR